MEHENSIFEAVLVAFRCTDMGVFAVADNAYHVLVVLATLIDT
jgi:hypothetical protein